MARPPRRHPEEPFARQVTVGLAKLGMVLKGEAWRTAAPRGLTPTQAQILALVRAKQGPIRLSELARGLGVRLPTASDAVRALVAKGYLRKEGAPEDRRALAISLTAAGIREADRVADWPDVLLKSIDTLSPDERALFLKVLVKMIRTLQEEGRIPVARMCAGCRFFRPRAHPEDRERPHHCAYVDAPFGDRALRLDCAEFENADDMQLRQAWARFIAAPVGRGAWEGAS